MSVWVKIIQIQYPIGCKCFFIDADKITTFFWGFTHMSEGMYLGNNYWDTLYFFPLSS